MRTCLCITPEGLAFLASTIPVCTPEKEVFDPAVIGILSVKEFLVQ